MEDHATLLEEFNAYWAAVGVGCEFYTMPPDLENTEIAVMFSSIGFPIQEWWVFHFFSPRLVGNRLEFGSIGQWGTEPTDLWILAVEIVSGRCVVVGDRTISRVNKGIPQFLKFLIELDKMARLIRIECPGDTEEDWAKGDPIVATMYERMRIIDDSAFDAHGSFWQDVLENLEG